MEDWFIKSWSADISFCGSDCKNTKCDRNLNSELFKRTQIHEWQLHSQCDFSPVCNSYKKG